MFMFVEKRKTQKSDRCKMREKAAFNHFVVKAALDRPLKESIFLAASSKLEIHSLALCRFLTQRVKLCTERKASEL